MWSPRLRLSVDFLLSGIKYQALRYQEFNLKNPHSVFQQFARDLVLTTPKNP